MWGMSELFVQVLRLLTPFEQDSHISACSGEVLGGVGTGRGGTRSIPNRFARSDARPHPTQSGIAMVVPNEDDKDTKCPSNDGSRLTFDKRCYR